VEASPEAVPAPPSAGLEGRAEAEIRSYLEGQREALERADRLREKAERLEASGTPSESAENRASRARGEVEEGLGSLRTRFVKTAAGGVPSGPRASEAGAAFDRAARRLYPSFRQGF